jgi:nuclear GTP-binding protein
MPKKSKKSLSKRQSLKDKFKIIRKVKEHNRKLRRNAKKAGKRKPSLLKDPGIPNDFPYRDQIVKELKFEKDRIAAKHLAQKEARKARQLKRKVRCS